VLVDCNDPRQREAVERQSETGVGAPITPGREFVEESPWNWWFEWRDTEVSDHRYDLDMSGHSRNMTIGADYRFSAALVAGGNLAFEEGGSEAFDDNMLGDSNGFSIGPYLAWRLSPAWVLDASLGYARTESETRIVVLSGSNTTHRYSAGLTASGEYSWGDTSLRPEATLSYAHFRNEAYELRGTFAGIPIALPVGEDNADSGSLEVTAELNHGFHGSAGRVLMPYAEVGVRYEFLRPNDGDILTGDLTLARPSAWTATGRVGARALVSPTMFIELGGGYLSFGQDGLDAWEARLFISHAF
jgi:outer membrane autotransporter protein